jgi:hypothetical protein
MCGNENHYRCKTHDLIKAIIHLDRYWKQTQALIRQPDVWRSIKKLAERLVVEGTMGADQVRQVLQSQSILCSRVPEVNYIRCGKERG